MLKFNVIYKVGKRGDDNIVVGDEFTFIDNEDDRDWEKKTKTLLDIVQGERNKAKKANYELILEKEDKGDEKSIHIIKIFEDYKSAGEELGNLLEQHFYRVEYGNYLYNLNDKEI